ncbi:hypothetical protein [Photobacterium kishitanii]|uniref:Uncharacterized protein n=1 Tax=Photobacterium kishitanii TaxID=318456 RepID=A0A2T3KN09_9GAMM|nr:hypothetical protein [Photobacterium kishitanii]PSV01162.1 hypothetical protein C9J27_03825 [Photobacterium kishitanii]
MIFSELMTQLEEGDIPFKLDPLLFNQELHNNKVKNDLLYMIINDNQNSINLSEFISELTSLDDSNESKNIKFLFRDLYEKRVHEIQKRVLNLPEHTDDEIRVKKDKINEITSTYINIVKPLGVGIKEKLVKDRLVDHYLSSSEDIQLAKETRLDELYRLISSEKIFSSDMFLGIAGKPKLLTRDEKVSIAKESKNVIKKYIDEFDVTASEFSSLLKNKNLGDFQKNQLRSSILELIKSDELSDAFKATLLSTTLKGSISKDKEMSLYNEHVKSVITPDIANHILDEITKEPKGTNKNIYSDFTAKQCIEKIICFHKNTLEEQDSIGVDIIGTIDDFKLIEIKLKNLGYDEAEMEAVISKSKEKPFDAARENISKVDGSLCLITSNSTRRDFKDISQEIAALQIELNFSTNTILTNSGKLKQKLLDANSWSKRKLLSDDRSFALREEARFFDTRFNRDYSRFHNEERDSDIKRVEFKSSNGKLLCVAEKDPLSNKSFYIRLDSKVKCDKDIASLMVLQYMKMNPNQDGIEVRPPKDSNPAYTEAFIKEVVKASIKAGFSCDKIKVASNDNVSKFDADRLRLEAINEIASNKPEAAVTAPSATSEEDKADEYQLKSGVSPVLRSSNRIK